MNVIAGLVFVPAWDPMFGDNLVPAWDPTNDAGIISPGFSLRLQPDTLIIDR